MNMNLIHMTAVLVNHGRSVWKPTLDEEICLYACVCVRCHGQRDIALVDSHRVGTLPQLSRNWSLDAVHRPGHACLVDQRHRSCVLVNPEPGDLQILATCPTSRLHGQQRRWLPAFSGVPWIV